jgi:hypothetical protein
MTSCSATSQEVDPGTEPAAIAPQAQCAGLDECACSQTPGCAPMTTDCWCPPAACGSTAACACEGGRFLACSPVGGSCHTSRCPLLALPSAPDQNGCVTCASPDTCADSLSRLAAACPSLPETQTRWMCSDDLSVCATFCLGQVRSCAGAECALCLGCSCSDDTLGSCVDECLTSISNRH